MEELLNIIPNVGFPIAVAVFLLVRIEGKMTCLTKAINDLREAILLMPGQSAAHTLSSVRVSGREGA